MSEPLRMRLDDLARRVAVSPLPTGMECRIVAVDGPGGSGKTVFAERLARALDHAPIVHTDDFASWEEPFDWSRRFVAQVLDPLTVGSGSRHQRYDWNLQCLAEWIETPWSPLVIIEGVGSSRFTFRPHLSFVFWIDTPRALRLERGLARDGASMRPQREQWMAAEDEYIALESPDLRADLVVAGAPTIEHDPETEVVIIATHTDESR